MSGTKKGELALRDKAILHQQRRLKQATQFTHKDSADLLPLDGLKRLGTSKDLVSSSKQRGCLKLLSLHRLCHSSFIPSSTPPEQLDSGGFSRFGAFSSSNARIEKSSAITSGIRLLLPIHPEIVLYPAIEDLKAQTSNGYLLLKGNIFKTYHNISRSGWNEPIVRSCNAFRSNFMAR